MDKTIFDNTILDKKVLQSSNFALTEAEIHVAFGISDNFMRPLGVMITSILENNMHIKTAIHIFINKINQSDMNRLDEIAKKYDAIIVLYYINDKIFHKLNNSQFTIAAYYRFLIPNELKNVAAKFLYLDADMVCVNSMSELFDIDFEGNIACVVEDHKVDKVNEPHLNMDGNEYFNSGMLFVNLQLWEKEKVSERCLDLLQKRSYEFRCFDQDALNIILEHKVKYIDLKWNCMCNLSKKEFNRILDIPKDTVFLHYNGFNKPWHKWCFHPIAKYFRKYSELSLWKAVELESIPKKYREMKMFSKYYLNQRSYSNAIYWFVRYSIKKIQEKYLSVK